MDIIKLAALARLSTTPEEQESLSKELGEILEYVNQVQNINGESLEVVKEIDSEKDLVNIMRDDVQSNTPGYATEKLLSLAPSRDGEYVKVKKIL